MTAIKIWSNLAPSTQKKYRAKGVSPQRYNAWVKTKQSTKETLAKRGISREDFLKASSTKEAKRANAEKRAADRMIQQLPRASATAIYRNVGEMTPSELGIALTATRDKLRSIASRKGYKVVSWSTEPVNPFWYR